MITVEDLEAKFENFLDSADAFSLEVKNSGYKYGDARRIYRNVTINNITPSETISALIDAEYKFTRDQFDRYVDRIVLRKSTSYIVNDSCYNPQDQQKSTTYMFINFAPTDQQWDSLVSCYTKAHKKKNFFWVDALIDTNYRIDNCKHDTLKNIGYNSLKLYDKIDISNNEFKEILKNCDKFNPNQIESIMKKYKIVGKTDHLFSLLERTTQITPGVCSLFAALVGSGAEIDDELIDVYLNGRTHHINMFKVLIKDKKQVNDDIVNRCLEIKDNTDHLLHLMDLGYFINQKITNSILKGNMHKFFSTYTMLKKKGAKFDENLLKLACELNDVVLIRTIIDEEKIYPTKECLDTALTILTQSNDCIKLILSYKIVPDVESVHALLSACHTKNTFNEKLTILISYGLIINTDIIDVCMASNIVIDLDQYGIECDEEIYFVCFKNRIFPPEYRFTIDQKRLQLRKLFMANNWFQTKSHMLNHRIKPDRYCMVSTLTQNMGPIFNLLNNGCDVEIPLTGNKHVNMKLYKKYNITAQYMAEIYDDFDFNAI